MICTASPLVAGWNRADEICLILLLHRNVSNSSLIQQELLSVTRTSGMPNWTNNVRETLVDVTESVGEAFIHLDWELITTRIILPLNGLVMSMWSLTQRQDGHFHGRSEPGQSPLRKRKRHTLRDQGLKCTSTESDVRRPLEALKASSYTLVHILSKEPVQRSKCVDHAW